MVDPQQLESEYKYLKEQFPLVTMVEPTLYRGMIRCERGPVKELAKQGVWPFTEYVKWQTFELELDPAYPYKPPIATWLTETPHPNIIPNQRGQVCVSVLGKGWTPTTKLAAIINSFYFLLSDPNPESTYPHATCISAAKVCKKHGFPKRRVDHKEEEAPRIQINIHKPITRSEGGRSEPPMAEAQAPRPPAYDAPDDTRYPPRYDDRDQYPPQPRYNEPDRNQYPPQPGYPDRERGQYPPPPPYGDREQYPPQPRYNEPVRNQYPPQPGYPDRERGQYPPPPQYGDRDQYPPQPRYGEPDRNQYPPQPGYGNPDRDRYPPPPGYGEPERGRYPPPPSQDPPLDAVENTEEDIDMDSPEEQESVLETINLRCPSCSFTFTVERTSANQLIECPFCHVQGRI